MDILDFSMVAWVRCWHFGSLISLFCLFLCNRTSLWEGLTGSLCESVWAVEVREAHWGLGPTVALTRIFSPCGWVLSPLEAGSLSVW